VDVGRRQVQWMNRYVRDSGAWAARVPEPHELSR
jgi:hypothetical protein